MEGIEDRVTAQKRFEEIHDKFLKGNPFDSVKAEVIRGYIGNLIEMAYTAGVNHINITEGSDRNLSKHSFGRAMSDAKTYVKDKGFGV